MGDDAKKFFLGINGEQAGPFSEEEVRQKLAAGEVNTETLVWYEGLSDWQPISGITYFKSDGPPPEPGEDAREKTIAAISAPAPTGNRFKPLSEVLGSPPAPAAPSDDSGDSGSSDADEPEPSISNFASKSARPLPAKDAGPERHEPAWKKKGKKVAPPDKDEVILTFAISGKKPRAVFSKKEAVFGAAGSKRIMMILGTGAAVAAVCGIFVWSQRATDDGPKVEVEKKIEPREVRLSRAKEDIILNPANGMQQMKALLAENSKDDVGRAAYQATELYYWEKQDYKGLGDLAMSVGDHLKAVDFFLKDPRLVAEVERAYKGIIATTQDLVVKKKAMLASIELLLGPLKRKNDAIALIKTFEKDFPSEPHPYQFYTLPAVKQIAELFERTSYYFLANLTGFIDGEFPHMKLSTAPLVEVRRDGDRYRISGTYRGDVRLFRDQLKGVFLHFWLVDGQWYVVETNITADRKRYAQDKRDQLIAKTLDEPSMLKYLETIFEQEFPRTPLHIRAPRNTAASAPRTE